MGVTSHAQKVEDQCLMDIGSNGVRFPHKVCPNYPRYDKDFSEGLRNVIQLGCVDFYLKRGRDAPRPNCPGFFNI